MFDELTSTPAKEKDQQPQTAPALKPFKDGGRVPFFVHHVSKSLFYNWFSQNIPSCNHNLQNWVKVPKKLQLSLSTNLGMASMPTGRRSMSC